MEPVLERGQHGPVQPELCVRPSGTGKASSCDNPKTIISTRTPRRVIWPVAPMTGMSILPLSPKELAKPGKVMVR